MGVELPLHVVVTILECCVTFPGVKLSIRSFVLFMGHIWVTYGSHMDHIWVTYGSYMIDIWVIHGPQMCHAMYHVII